MFSLLFHLLALHILWIKISSFCVYCEALKAVLVTRRSFVTIHGLKNVKWNYKYRLVDGFGNSTLVFTTKEGSSHFSKEYLKDFHIFLTGTFNVQTTSSAILQSLAFLKQCINCARYEQAEGFQLYFRWLKNKQGKESKEKFEMNSKSIACFLRFNNISWKFLCWSVFFEFLAFDKLGS